MSVEFLCYFVALISFGLCAAQVADLGEIIVTKMRYNETRPHRHGGKRA